MPEPLPAPRPLYGTLDVVGKGWRRVVNRAWKEGWKSALEGMEWIDLWRSPGPIIYESRPGGMILNDHFRKQPFFAAYLTPHILHGLADREPNDSAGRSRHMDLHLEALAWPWYLFGMGYPHAAPFIGEGTPEEKASARAALKASLPHFLIIRQFEHRLSPNGTFGAQQLMRMLAESNPKDHLPKGSWGVEGWGWVGVYLGDCMRAGLARESVERLIGLPSLEACEHIMAWARSEGIID